MTLVLVFALVGLVGITLLVIGIACGTNSESRYFNRWVAVFIIGLVLVVVGWTGGLAIQDIEDAAQQEYQYEYNYCPHCGERLKEIRQ